jgi:hypothetical protein
MTEAATQPTTTTFATLPAIGAPLDGGIFAGITTKQDGTHHAVVLLPEQASNLTWKKAMNWAAKQGGELPSRPVVSLLFANVKPSLKPAWHWTSEVDDASCAWNCYFDYGAIHLDHKSYEGCAGAVRLIHITA